MLTTKQVADRLGVSTQTVRRYVQAGLLDGRQFVERGEIKITEESLKALLDSRERKSP